MFCIGGVVFFVLWFLVFDYVVVGFINDVNCVVG